MIVLRGHSVDGAQKYQLTSPSSSYDVESLKPGPKRYMRALIWVKLSKPLVPGCYIEYEPGNLLWVDFRYEGVFRFCNKCGRIGHMMNACSKSWEVAEQELNGAIRAHSQAREIVFGQNQVSLYTNKIKGLPNTPLFRTTAVNLFSPPNDGGKWHPFSPFDDGRSGGSDGDSDNNGGNDQPRRSPMGSSQTRNDNGSSEGESRDPPGAGSRRIDRRGYEKVNPTPPFSTNEIQNGEGIVSQQELLHYILTHNPSLSNNLTENNQPSQQQPLSPPSSTTAAPTESSFDWSGFARDLAERSSSGSFWDPRSPINYPGTHDHPSLGTGSSSSFHSSATGVPYQGFENLQLNFVSIGDQKGQLTTLLSQWPPNTTPTLLPLTPIVTLPQESSHQLCATFPDAPLVNESDSLDLVAEIMGKKGNEDTINVLNADRVVVPESGDVLAEKKQKGKEVEWEPEPGVWGSPNKVLKMNEGTNNHRRKMQDSLATDFMPAFNGPKVVNCQAPPLDQTGKLRRRRKQRRTKYEEWYATMDCTMETLAQQVEDRMEKKLQENNLSIHQKVDAAVDTLLADSKHKAHIFDLQFLSVREETRKGISACLNLIQTNQSKTE
ncbi:hypothetical protein RDABS01_008345 [Bienertia sinuspersici]